MPNRNEIVQEIITSKETSQDIVRRRFLTELQANTRRDTIIYASAATAKKAIAVPSAFLMVSQEDIQAFMTGLHGLSGNELDLIIHSPGGSLEATEQIVTYLRKKYTHIRAIIPQNAMSAATMLACACDEIVMGKHSAIGPIDPQITFPTANGNFTAPAQSLLDEFARAKDEVRKDPASSILWIAKIKGLPPGILNMCDDTISLAKLKVRDWLKAYMFKSDTDAQEKADKISEWLGTANEHKTHGHPISADLAKEKGLKIVDLESDQVLQEKVLSLFHATMVTFDLTPCVKLVENHTGKGWYSLVGPNNSKS